MWSNSENSEVDNIEEKFNIKIHRQQRELERLNRVVDNQQHVLHSIMTKLDNLILGQQSSNLNNAVPDSMNIHFGSNSKKHNNSISSPDRTDNKKHNSIVNSDRQDDSANVNGVFDIRSKHLYKESPKPEPFSISSGRSFNRFLQRFESYCSGKFAPETFEQWTGELGVFLKGDILEVFRAYGGSDNDYSLMKYKLLQYCNEADDEITSNKHNKFLYAKRQDDEKLYHYALRLEQLFLAAHPGKSTDNSHELMAHFLKTIPTCESQELEKDLALMKAISGDNVSSWNKLMKLLRNKNSESSSSNMGNVGSSTSRSPVGSGTPSIWYNSNAVIPTPNNNYSYSAPYYSSASGAVGGFPSYKPPPFYQPPISVMAGHTNNLSTFPSFGRGQPRVKQGVGYSNNFSGTRIFQSSTQNSNRSSTACTFCNGENHTEARCRRKLGLCLRCGSSEHFYRFCDRPFRYNRSQSRDRSSSQTEYLNSFPSFGSNMPPRNDNFQANIANVGNTPVTGTFGETSMSFPSGGHSLN